MVESQTTSWYGHAPSPATDREYLVEIYASLGQLQSRMGQLENTVAAFHIMHKEDLGRIGAIEEWRWKVTGGLMLLTFVLGTLGSVIVNHLFHIVP